MGKPILMIMLRLKIAFIVTNLLPFTRTIKVSEYLPNPEIEPYSIDNPEGGSTISCKRLIRSSSASVTRQLKLLTSSRPASVR